jgi:hypothetical protein
MRAQRERGNHLRDPANARVARIEVVLLVHDPVAGFDELAGADTHSVTDRTEYFSIAVQLQELAILSARHPWLAVRVKIEGADEVSHLHGLDEPAVARIDDDTVFLAVANPDIAVAGINGEPMDRAEFPLSDLVAVPLIDEPAVPIEVDDPRGTDIVGCRSRLRRLEG